MRFRKSIQFTLRLAFCFLLASAVSAAEFSPTLRTQLDAVGQADFISAIVILESPLDIRALDLRLHEDKTSLSKRHQDVIAALKYNAASTQPAFRAEFDSAIREGDMIGYTPYWIENLFVIRATRRFIENLRDRGDIRYVTENFRAELIEPVEGTQASGSPDRARNNLDSESIEPGQFAVGATRVNQELGITGQGTLVANLDYGVDGNHPAVAARWRGNFVDPDSAHHCWLDLLGNSPDFPADSNGHGTHVMGIMCGREFIGQDTVTVGAAPDARWIACNAIDQSVGVEFDNDVLTAFQWFADPDGNPATLDDVPDVVENSWGVHAIHGYVQCYDYWNTAILNCEAAGTVMIFSAGNESTNSLRSPAIYQLNETQVFAVGSVDATNYSAPYPLSTFSSEGPTPCQPDSGAIKPEIVAPGTEVRSCIAGGGYGTKNGTSMSAPHVAGVVALMREACPDCDPITIKETLMMTAIDNGYGPAGPDNQFGSGMIDAYAAVLAVASIGRVSGIVDDGTDPLDGVEVKVANAANHVFTDPTGEYDLPLNEGTYDLEYLKFGYETFTVFGVSVTQGDTTYQNVTLVPANFGLLSGTVTDCFASPAVGAKITILNTPEDPIYTDSAGYYSIILPQAYYDVQATVCGCGEEIAVQVALFGAAVTQDFTIAADPTFLCGAPDAAGYIACDNCDDNGPTYEWFEISPDGAGPGIWTGITGDDQSGLLNLPFTFRIYGADYNQVYINSNGWLTFDDPNTEWTNQTFPDPQYGHAVAPFWDDLNPNGSEHICYYHDAAQNAMIIEWYQIGHYNDLPSTETFQVWLYNVTTNPTPGGDSQVLFRYLDMTSLGSATVGIQNGAIDNLYEFNGVRGATERGVRDERAIAIGGHESLPFGTLEGIVTDDLSLEPISGAAVQPIGVSGSAATDSLGAFSLNLLENTYDIVISKSGYISDTLFSITITPDDTIHQDVALSGLQLIMVLDDDFENSPAWLHDSPVSWQDNWHLSTERSRSGTNSYKCGHPGAGDYENFCDSRLTSIDVLNLPAGGRLSFYHQLEAELVGGGGESWDGAVIEVSADSGTFTQVTPEGGYPFIFRPGSEGPLPGEPCFSGDIPLWQLVEVDLAAFAGSDIRIRWRFGTDYSITMEGWYIDDVQIWGYAQGELIAPDDLTIQLDSTGSNVEFRWGDTGDREYELYSSLDPAGPFNTLEGTTADTSLTLPLPMSDLVFYIVHSTYGGLAVAEPPVGNKSSSGSVIIVATDNKTGNAKDSGGGK